MFLLEGLAFNLLVLVLRDLRLTTKRRSHMFCADDGTSQLSSVCDER